MLCVLVSTPVQAATQGGLGTSSTGSIDISLNLREAVRISGLSDIVLDARQGEDTHGTSSVCIYQSRGLGFKIKAVGNGQMDNFAISANQSNIEYSVAFQADGNSVQLSPGIPVSVDTVKQPSKQDCSASGPNAQVEVSIKGTESDKAVPGEYVGILTLVVSVD